MMGHTPTPWNIGIYEATYKVIGADNHEAERLSMLESAGKLQFKALSIGSNDGQVAIVPLDESNKDNAIHIVKCVNAYDDLIKVLKLSTNVLEAVHAAESRDDAREMLGKLIMANRAVLERVGEK